METPMKLFDRSVRVTDQVYIALRDDGDFTNARNHVEELWRYFEPYADPHFRKEIADNFQPRYWEMYLGYLALRAKLSVMSKKKNRGKGPDLQVTLTTGQNLFIEATAPGPGTGDNEVPEPTPLRVGVNEIAQDIPIEKILLRITSSIETKFEAYDRYLRDQILRPNDPYIVAVNPGAMPSARGEFFDPPLIIRSLFGVGNLMVSFDRDNPGLNETHYSICHQIIKHNDEPIGTKYFLDSRYCGLSAIIFSDAHPLSLPKPDGSEFKLVHNPDATNPVDRGLFKIGREYWAEGTRIHSTNWNEHSSRCYP
jgi:hypothetical protein